MSARPVPPQRLLELTAGFGLWCSALVALYAVHAVGCAFAWSVGPLRFGLAAVLLGHLIAIGWIWRNLVRDGADPAFGQTGSFLHKAVVSTVIAAFVATVLTLGPPLLLTTCR